MSDGVEPSPLCGGGLVSIWSGTGQPDVVPRMPVIGRVSGHSAALTTPTVGFVLWLALGIAVLRLALCLDKQNKYPEALKEANHAVDLTQDSTPAGKMARQERDRLAQLTGGTPPAAPKK